jgi:hypothetical protein
MASSAEMRLAPSELSFRVLQKEPSSVSADQAVRAVTRFLQRKRKGLAKALEISASGGEVVIRASGEAPHEMLREAGELLGLGQDAESHLEIEVDPAEFAVAVLDIASEEPRLEQEILRSKVRYFPHPSCEWFEISSGLLLLSSRQVAYEPDYVVMADDQAGAQEGAHAVALGDIRRVYRGEWWDIPCLMIETADRTYRYGWASERAEPETVFEVDEWLDEIRFLLGDSK